LILNGDQPAVVSDQIIDDLRRREVGGLIELARPMPLKPGARVRIVTGAFADHVAILVRMKPRERIEALLQLLGAEQKVTLARSAVEVCS
jgi:transcription antitermination factor NusG